MRLQHKFVYSGLVGEPRIINQDREILIKNDMCVYCGIIIDNKMQLMFTGYKPNKVKTIYLKLNKLYPCLTEEEYIIKQMLE